MNVAIVGATGYGGIQLVNLLRRNRNFKLSFLGGNKSAGTRLRKSMQEIKTLAQEVRVEVQQQKNSVLV